MSLFEHRYQVTFTNLDNERVCHYVIQHDDKYEAFHAGQSIGVYDNLIEAADAVRWLDNLIVWKPSVSELLLRN